MSENQPERFPRPMIDHDKLRHFHDQILRRAAKSDNPEIAEMAREIQSGRLSRRDAMFGSAYREALGKVTEQLGRAIEGMDRDELEKKAREQSLEEIIDGLADIDEQPDDEPAPPAEAAPRRPEADDTDFDAPIMTSGIPEDRDIPAGSPQRARWQRRRS